MYDPNVDLLRADWSPFHETAWVMPLLTELSGWREKYNEILQDIYRDRNDTGAHFMADFPGNWALFNQQTSLTHEFGSKSQIRG